MTEKSSAAIKTSTPQAISPPLPRSSLVTSPIRTDRPKTSVAIV
jgi:hypothetical protein